MSAPHRDPADNARAQRLIRARKQLLIRAYKAERGCAVCGECDPIVLDLHHRDPSTKHPLLSRGATWQSRLSFDAIALEFEKCDVLCANCHRRRHGA